MITWILVSDAAEARVYSMTGPAAPLKLEWELSHRKSRVKGSSLLTDRPGRVRKTATGRSAFAMDPHTAPKEVEAEHFANEVAAKLGADLAEHRFELLALVAAPHFQGLLSDRLGPQVQKSVVTRLEKDFMHVRPVDLPKRLRSLRLIVTTEQHRREAWK